MEAHITAQCQNVSFSEQDEKVYFGLIDPVGNNTTSTEKYSGLYLKAQFITGLIFYPIFCIFGLSGNILSIIVLSQKKMRTPTNIYLISLAISDSIKLINDVLYFISILLWKIDPATGSNLYAQLYPYAHYLFNMSACCSAWLTVSVASERYMLVCKPARAKDVCNFKSARRLCIGTFVVTALLTFPLGIRYKSVRRWCGGKGVVKVVLTSLWQNNTFALTYTWIHNSIRTLVPIVVVSTMNYFIIRALRKSSARTGSRRNSMHRITIMLISVIVVFILCVTPDAIISTIFGYGYVEANYLVRAIREITDLLLLVNSAVNFVLYCTFNYVFRKNFMALFCRVDMHESPLPVEITPHIRRSQHAVNELAALNIEEEIMLDILKTPNPNGRSMQNGDPMANGTVKSVETCLSIAEHAKPCNGADNNEYFV